MIKGWDFCHLTILKKISLSQEKWWGHIPWWNGLCHVKWHLHYVTDSITKKILLHNEPKLATIRTTKERNVSPQSSHFLFWTVMIQNCVICFQYNVIKHAPSGNKQIYSCHADTLGNTLSLFVATDAALTTWIVWHAIIFLMFL